MFLPSSPEPREQRPQTPQLALRVAVLGTVGLFVFAVLVFRLWALQVLASDTYRARATAQQVKQVSIPAARGDIVDVNGNPARVEPAEPRAASSIRRSSRARWPATASSCGSRRCCVPTRGRSGRTSTARSGSTRSRP